MHPYTCFYLSVAVGGSKSPTSIIFFNRVLTKSSLIFKSNRIYYAMYDNCLNLLPRDARAPSRSWWEIFVFLKVNVVIRYDVDKCRNRTRSRLVLCFYVPLSFNYLPFRFVQKIIFWNNNVNFILRQIFLLLVSTLIHFMLKTISLGTGLFKIVLIAVNLGAKLSNLVVIN